MLSFLITIIENMLFVSLHIGTDASFPKPLSPKREKEELEKMMNGDKEARETLIIHNLRLVAHIIKKYYSSYSEQEDLISIGTIGLIKGIDSFNVDKGIRLATYVSRCVENEVLMYFRSQKKSAGDLSLSDSLEGDGDGNSLSLLDVLTEESDLLENVSRAELCRQAREYSETRLDPPALRPRREKASDTAGGGPAVRHQPQLCIAHREKSPGKAAAGAGITTG